jgi:HD-GYP domain-containing protein (c-di-GMP phosphodiesterase class II)
MACALVSAGAGAILLLEAMFDELKVEVSEGADGWPEDTGFLKAARWSCDNGRPLLLSRGSRERRFKVASGISGGMVAPLLIRDKAIGVIAIAAKPGSEYDRDDLELFANFAAQAAVSIENTQLYERLQDMYLGAIGSLAAAIEARDPYTVGHSARVTQYAVAIAEGMGLTQPEIEELRLAGLLHDLGKIGVPDSILNKPGRLSEEEFSAIKMHPALSMRIIEPLPHLGNIIPIIYHHHEHFDGSGYMDGKSGEKIPLGARIITVADSFEAMTSDRPYRKALSRHEAMMELKRCSGSQFDPRVVSVFVDLLEKTADEGS